MIKMYKLETPKGNFSNDNFVIKNGQKSVIYQHRNDVIATYDFASKKLLVDCDYFSVTLEKYIKQFLQKFAYNEELGKMNFFELLRYCDSNKLIQPLNQQEQN